MIYVGIFYMLCVAIFLELVHRAPELEWHE
jgi:hypothetical protein